MKIKNYTIIFVLVLLAIGFSSAASYHNKFSVDVGTGSVVIDPGMCEEDWGSSFWNSCSGGEQTFICVQSNPECGGENLKPSLCGDTRVCTEDTNDVGGNTDTGGGGGGGGSSNRNNNLVLLSNNETLDEGEDDDGESSGECSERWACQEWSNSDGLCGIRVCRDVNECGTTELRPEISRECSSVGLAGLTGAFAGAIKSLSKSKSGISLVFIVLVIAAFVLVNVSRRKMDGKIAKSVAEVKKNGLKSNGNSK